MTTPAGICLLFVTGGGDCRRLPRDFSAFASYCWIAVPGGDGSAAGSKVVVVFTEGVRRCRVRYEVDLGSSGLLEVEGLVW